MSRGTCLKVKRQEHTNSCQETSIKKLQAAQQLRHSIGNHPCSLSEQLEKQTSIKNAIIKKKNLQTQENPNQFYKSASGFQSSSSCCVPPGAGLSNPGGSKPSSGGFASFKGEEVLERRCPHHAGLAGLAGANSCLCCHTETSLAKPWLRETA